MQLLFLTLALLTAGLPDRGIFPDLDALVKTTVPPSTQPARTWLRVDSVHKIVTLYEGADPLKAYPAAVSTSIKSALRSVSAQSLSIHAGPLDKATDGVALRPEDFAELSTFITPETPALAGKPARDEDRDGDGIVDRIDILLGAKKLLFNHAKYIERYVSIKYPGGDVPRTEGVCSDTVIRALRNAGIDLQKEVHEDILAARAAYPMVEKVDASINHRRVHTILPWFSRHFKTMPKGTPYRPGDIVFFDTFPSRDGPDHLGVVSDTIATSGNPMIINNWTDGAVDAEMDLLSFVPVTHQFRAPSPPRPAAAK